MNLVQSVRVRVARFSWLTWLLIIGVLWLAIALAVWWRVVYTDPRHVFEGMLKNNFATAGYTRESTSAQQGLQTNEIAQLQTGQQNLVRTLTTLTQGNDVVVTDAINTAEYDYVRYVKINTSRKDETGKVPDFSKAVGVWARNESDGNKQAIAQMMLGIFPIGNVPANKRAELMKFMDKNTVFSVKYDTVKKETINGRRVYTYEAQLLPQPYVALLKQYAQTVGFGDQVSNLDPADYANAAPTDLTVSVDVLSRHLQNVKYGGSAKNSETYSAFGMRQDVQLPQKTITGQELQQRLSPGSQQ